MRKLLVGIVALGLLGGCNHGEIRKVPTTTTNHTSGATCKDGSHSSSSGKGACSHHGGVALRQQVLQLPDGADYVGQCETIQNTVTPTQLKAEGWTLDECFKAFL